jgi:DNA-binding CsgD family transcriptional regulator
MRHNEGYRRRRGAWQPSDRQRQVLDALVEGKSNAEIAVRLGITVDGAKWHVSELLGETGFADRQELAAWWRSQRAGRARGWLLPLAGLLKPAVAVLTFVALALTGVAVLSSRKDASPRPPLSSYPPVPTAVPPTPWPEEAVAALAEQDKAPENCEPPEKQDLRLVTEGELTAQGLVDLGRVVFTGQCPLYVANRADRIVAWLGGGGYVSADFSRERGFGPCCSYGYFHFGGQEYELLVYSPVPTDPFGALEQSTGGLLKVNPVEGDGSFLMLEAREWVEASPGPVSVGPEHRSAVSSDGHLFVDPTTLPGSSATNWLTGEAIDVSGLTHIGSLPLIDSKPIRNDCYANEGVCSVQYDNGPAIPSPLGGVLRCVRDGSEDGFELDTGSLRLRLSSFGGYKFASSDCTERPILRGDLLPSATYFSIEAFAPDGSPLSLVVTRDGSLYVGDVKLQVGCPCEPRN